MEKEEKVLTSKELIIDLLSRLHPDSDLSDEDVLFGHIYDDYSQYAQVLEDRDKDIAQAHEEGCIEGRNTKIEEIIDSQTTTPDPIPNLGGVNTLYTSHTASIFDIARGTV